VIKIVPSSVHLSVLLLLTYFVPSVLAALGSQRKIGGERFVNEADMRAVC
jgi:hypothetical protein